MDAGAGFPANGEIFGSVFAADVVPIFHSSNAINPNCFDDAPAIHDDRVCPVKSRIWDGPRAPLEEFTEE
jgi:hypothetical protein